MRASHDASSEKAADMHSEGTASTKQAHEFSTSQKNVITTAFLYLLMMSVRLGCIGFVWEPQQSSEMSALDGDGKGASSRQLKNIDTRPGNRTLVILIGSVRGGERPWETLYQNMLDPNMADLALVVGWDDEAGSSSSLFKRAKYVVHFPEYHDWSEAMDVMERWQTGDGKPRSSKQRRTWRDIALAQSNGLFGATREDPRGSGGVQNFARWWVSNTINVLGLQEKYDRFIVTRTDYYYQCETDLRHLDKDAVWIPVGQDWDGLCDRFIIGDSHNINMLMDIIQSLVHHPNKWVCTEKMPESCGGEIEVVYKTRLQQNYVGKIKRFERTMFAVKRAEDKTRWGSPEGEVMDGLYFKYVDEYHDGMEFCSARDDAREETSTSLPLIQELSVEEYEIIVAQRRAETEEQI